MFEDLLKISQKIVGHKEIGEILVDVAQAVTEISPFKRAIISLYDKAIDPQNPQPCKVTDFSHSGLTPQEEEKLAQRSAEEVPVNLDKFDQRYKLSNSYYTPHSERPESFEEIKGQLKSKIPMEEMADWHPDDSLYIPLYQEENIIGHISIDDPADGKIPTEDTLKPIETFANLAAMAVSKARRIDQLRSQKESIKALHSLGFELAAIEDLDQLLERVLQILEKDFHYEYGAILLKEGNHLVLKAQKTLSQEDLIHQEGKKLKIGEEGIAGWVASNQRAALVNDVTQDSRYIPGISSIKSELSVPIQAGDKLFGVLDIESMERGAFDDGDLELLGSIASQLAVAISNLNRNNELQELVIKDELTGTFNRRHFFEILNKELDRAKRYERRLCLLLLDIDGLKTVNDKYGHQAGDQLLEELGPILQDNSRNSDQVYRYGGDEFTVILPETSIEGAKEAAERLRKGVGSYVFRKGTRITASVGISTFPEDGEDKDTLIDEADRRAYIAKKNDGDQVIFK